MTAHFIDPQWTMKTFVLGTVAFDGHHTSVRIADLLSKTTRSAGITDDRVVAHVHDEAADAELAGRLLFDSFSWRS